MRNKAIVVIIGLLGIYILIVLRTASNVAGADESIQNQEYEENSDSSGQTGKDFNISDPDSDEDFDSYISSDSPNFDSYISSGSPNFDSYISSDSPNFDSEDSESYNESSESYIDNSSDNESSDNESKTSESSSEIQQSTASSISVKISQFKNPKFDPKKFFKNPKPNTKVEYYKEFSEITNPEKNCKNPWWQAKLKSTSKTLNLTECSNIEIYQNQFLGTSFNTLNLKNSDQKLFNLLPGEIFLFKCNTSEIYFEYNPKDTNLTASISASDSVSNIILISIRSLSRANAHSRLKKSLKFLKNPKKTFLDFEYQSIPSLNCSETASNLLYGHSLQLLQSIKLNFPPEFTYVNSFSDELEKNSLWHIFSQNSFKTLVLYSKIPKTLQEFTDGRINVDYSIVNYWDALEKCSSFCCEGRKCDKRHEAVFDQAKNFIEIESQKNKFLFLHFLVNDTEAFDSELESFLKTIEDSIGEKQKLALFLLSDHGMYSENPKNTIQEYFEENVPAAFLYYNKKFRDSSKLIDNTDKVITKFDIYHTLSQIARNEKNTGHLYESENIYNIIDDKIDRNNCDETKRLGLKCPVANYTNVNAATKKSLEKSLKDFLALKNCEKKVSNVSVFGYDIEKSNDVELFEMFFTWNSTEAKAYSYSKSGKTAIEALYYLRDSEVIKLISC